MELDKSIRERFTPEIEEKYHKKVRNVYFLVRGCNDKNYYICEGNNSSKICVIEIDEENYQFI